MQRKRFNHYLFTLTISLILTVLSPFAGAEVYKTVDEKGKTVFTDQPLPGAEAVEVKEPNTVPPTQVRNLPPQTDKATPEYGVEITSPTNERLFPNRLSPFTVTTQVTPALKKGHRLRLKIDGKVHGISTGSFTVDQLGLGRHTLQVEIIGASGAVITQSTPITVFARQPG